MFKAIRSVCRECWRCRKRLVSMSLYNLLFQYNQTKLKLLWTFLNPLLQALTYWLAFYVGMRASSPVEGVSYLCWMLTGLMPWFFISGTMMTGLNSIISGAGIIKNMKFPISSIPVSTVLTEFITHLCYMVILVFVQLISGIRYGPLLGFVPYFMLCELVFLIGYTFLMSALTVFFRDLQKLVSSIVRLMFFLTPVCWSDKGTPMEYIQKWNPFAYILKGFRASMLNQDMAVFESWEHVYFWGISILFLLFGIWVHKKLRPSFVDYL